MKVDEVPLSEPTTLEKAKAARLMTEDLEEWIESNDIELDDTGMFLENIDFFIKFVEIHTPMQEDTVESLSFDDLIGLINRTVEFYSEPASTELFGGVEVKSTGEVTLK